MTEQWDEIKRIFGAAIELPTGDRVAYLDKQCRDDEQLRREVEDLLEQHDQSDTFLEVDGSRRLGQVGAEHTASPNGAGADTGRRRAWVGRVLDRYRIVDWIGAGGMGSVFLGERADEEFEKSVAIKVLKRGMDTDEILRRFRLERQVLARLEHAHIARLLDGGATDEGSPYLVMEYVDGQPIDTYCETHELSVDRRLTLFLDVCDAVEYAHRNLVVHRDLKPGNIFVTKDGEAKLLDFGIAKMIEPHGEEGTTTALTDAAVMRLTPRYASPEQIRGEPVTTATDVYALCVILYELLTGHNPYRVPEVDRLGLARAICEVEPLRPSTAVVRTNEGKTETIPRE